MGYADIGPFGAKAYPTPHLDRMAREGRKFTDFYVTQAVCSAHGRDCLPAATTCGRHLRRVGAGPGTALTPTK
ncbi:MAG: hypothetical protein Ct9H300mP7_1410 [Verrucomicrobiota bacterium]|nr:MAG: hypothetical protein Ct9H300mP7_1410 [Verrucomicrobiota bacterium]